ncbi:MAG: hypothetical protein WD403_03755 [Pirellulales bacterium]
MPRCRRAIVIGLVMAVGCSGCAHGRSCAVRPMRTPRQTLEQALPPAERASFEFDVSGVGSLDEVNRILGRPTEGNYWLLTAEECQCMAAAASTQGNSLAAEQRAIRAAASHKGLSEDDRVKLRVLRASEQEARNSSASGALEVFYRLAEAEANLAILEESLAEIDSTLGRVAQIREQGVQIPFDASELGRQRVELVDKQVELMWTAGQLSSRLIRMVGLSTDDALAHIWPSTDWKVKVEPIDMELAVAEGLSLRPEMGLLRSLGRSINTDTLGVVRQVLSGGSGLLGAQPKASGLVALLGLRQLAGQGRANARELPTRRRQLADYTEQRADEISGDIRQAVLTVEARLRQIALAREQTQSWETRVQELEKLQTTGQATFAEISTAKLGGLQAQSDAVAAIVAWKVALVQLKEAQGLLIEECQALWCAPVLAAPSS